MSTFSIESAALYDAYQLTLEMISKDFWFEKDNMVYWLVAVSMVVDGIYEGILEMIDGLTCSRRPIQCSSATRFYKFRGPRVLVNKLRVFLTYQKEKAFMRTRILYVQNGNGASSSATVSS